MKVFNRMRNRGMALFTASMMSLSLLPMAALAADVEDPAAKIGEIGFATLEEAVSQAEPGSIIELANDIELSSIVIDKNVTLDLNGYSITQTSGDSAAIVASGNLTIRDSSADQTGSIVALNDVFQGSVTVTAGSYSQPVDQFLSNGLVSLKLFSEDEMYQVGRVSLTDEEGDTSKELFTNYGTRGATLYLTLVSNGYEFDLFEDVEWTSSNESVATVDEFGEVAAVGDGDAVITAAYEDITATYAVSVSTYTVTVVSPAPSAPAVDDPDENIDDPYVPLGQPFLFDDVSEDRWYYDAMKFVFDEGLMDSLTASQYAPAANTTRGVLVTALYRMEGEPAAASANFSDVAAGSEYANAVNWAAANGIVNGYGDGTFGADNLITREQMAAILYRFAEYKAYDLTDSKDLASFPDGGSVSGWAVKDMQWATGVGLINGTTGGALNPMGFTTRAETAQMILRFCQGVAAIDWA